MCAGSQNYIGRASSSLSSIRYDDDGTIVFEFKNSEFVSLIILYPCLSRDFAFENRTVFPTSILIAIGDSDWKGKANDSLHFGFYTLDSELF